MILKKNNTRIQLHLQLSWCS